MHLVYRTKECVTADRSQMQGVRSRYFGSFGELKQHNDVMAGGAVVLAWGPGALVEEGGE